MLDKIGLLDTINGLLGRTMVTYTESKLIMLSGVFSIMLGIIRFLYELIHILLVNATVRMIGGIPVKLYDADSNAVRNSKKNNTVTVPADVSINANNDANSIGSKHHRVIISESHENNDDMTDSHQIIGTDNDSSHAINDDNQDSHASINHDSSIDSTSLSRLATRSAETETFSSLNHPDSEL